MSSLPTALRRLLETACRDARRTATTGARKALEALAVHEATSFVHMDEGQCKLRERLQAQAKQLGDEESQYLPGAHEIKHLVEKLAYDQWHRLLFARFLLENNILISPEHEVSVTLDDCEELAPSLGLRDAWAVAARFAAKELPQIFRADDSAGAVDLPVEDRNPLIQLVTGLPVEVFTASDSLGWCYQFWQAERKDEVNAEGNKIGAEELPAVTQLFTEDYMVDFLLDNTLGAWHAGKVLAAQSALAETAEDENELRNAVALPGCPWRYLRFIKAANGRWTPAAGTFDSWPQAIRDLKCLDPCMGSGHFVVAMFERLVALVIAEGMLDEAAAVDAIIRDNLFGLEIDPRCTQIAAFNLALAAWRRVGHCALPLMNLACSGLAPNAKQEDWIKLAGDDDRLRNGMERLYRLFKNGPTLGSLINPGGDEGDLLVAAFHELQPLVEKALAKEIQGEHAHEMAVTARGLAKAAELLAGRFTLVATNVPYLGRGKQGDVLKQHLDQHYARGKADLATAFVERCLQICDENGTAALVTPQSWLFLGSYRTLREELLRKSTWNVVARLGPRAFETIGGEVVNVSLLALTRATPREQSQILALDVVPEQSPAAKMSGLLGQPLAHVLQSGQLLNPDSRIILEERRACSLLRGVAASGTGMQTFDGPRFLFAFWELGTIAKAWLFGQSTVDSTTMYSGCFVLVRWEEGKGDLFELMEMKRSEGYTSGIWRAGVQFWNRNGVLVSLMSTLPCSLYLGGPFDNNTAAIVPADPTLIPALWCFCSSSEFAREVRSLDQALKVTTNTLEKIPFDSDYWKKVAEEKYPNGLPQPASVDPTQWLFNGHPTMSDQPLHTAVPRLLGYQWPRQSGSTVHDCPPLGPDGLEEQADQDGIVCISATKGEAPAAERLRALLVKALPNFEINALIQSAGPKGSRAGSLEEWLRDQFFEQHCEVFHHRPFIWHIWDGHKTGFSALVNYHKLTHANLEKLTYAYLGDWIRRQQAAVDGGEAGSDARLQAARQLQARLKLILQGEPPYDLFVRWKPLSKQAIGWHPDLNDGVRMNIRPFSTADVLRKRVKIKWDKDRGKEPVRDKREYPWFWGWDEKTRDFAGTGAEPDGTRWNDCHYTNEFKRKAREG